MKSKLRKEFEIFRKETQREIWLLKNPPKFKFGDKLMAHYDHDYAKYGECICKSVKEVEDLSWDSRPYFRRVYYVEFPNENIITTWIEGGLQLINN